MREMGGILVEVAVAEKVEVIYGAPEDVSRPLLKDAYAWTIERLAEDGTLDRSFINAPQLAPLIRHVSLFEFMMDGDTVVDFKAKVLASVVANNIFEISGRYGKENLPAPLFKRWLFACQKLYDDKQGFCTKSSVYRKSHKSVESLSIPVRENGALNHALVFTDYWVD